MSNLTYTYIIIALFIFTLMFYLLWRRSVKLLKAVKFSKISLSTKYGKMSEQFMPFLAHYPYDPQNFRFLGTPIDGVQFTPEEIVFIEFKVATSQLSTLQRQIRNNIQSGRIRFEEIRI